MEIFNQERGDFDIVLDSLDIPSGKVPLITLYNNDTKDYPGKYVARLFLVGSGTVERTRYIMFGNDLNELRDKMPPNMARFQRHSTDDPVVIEVYI